MIYVIGPKSTRKDYINTTSRSTNWSRGLSPFILGPVKISDTDLSQNVENAWQYSKVYQEHVDADNNPTEKWWEWARAGWAKSRADRYPMGRGVKPLFSYHNGQKMTYIEARKRLYAPWYAGAVEKTDAFAQLKKEYESSNDIYLWDFDAYDHRRLGMSYLDVMNCEIKKMGHAFILAMLLENQRVWNEIQS